MKIKYIATTKEYRDKVHGNSYFSSNIEDIKNDKNYILPFQYGYGTQSEHEVKKIIKSFDKKVSWDNIKFIKINRCLKKEVVEHGKGIEENYNNNLGYYYQD